MLVYQRVVVMIISNKNTVSTMESPKNYRCNKTLARRACIGSSAYQPQDSTTILVEELSRHQMKMHMNSLSLSIHYIYIYLYLYIYIYIQLGWLWFLQCFYIQCTFRSAKAIWILKMMAGATLRAWPFALPLLIFLSHSPGPVWGPMGKGKDLERHRITFPVKHGTWGFIFNLLHTRILCQPSSCD